MQASQIIPFVKVDWTHSFYEDYLLRDLQVTPLKTSMHLMKKAGFFMKKDTSSLTIGYTKNKTETFLDKKEIKLIFLVKNNNPYFQNFTDLSFYSPQDKLIYFDNLFAKNTTKNITDGDIVAIGKNQIKVSTTNDFIKVTTPNKEVKEVKVAQSGTAHASIDLSTLSPDLLTVEGQNQPAYYTVGLMQTAFGYLHLYLNKSMLPDEDTNLKSVGNKNNYQFHFNHRRVYFRYYFTGNIIEQNPDVEIEIAPFLSKIKFQKLHEKRQLSDGRQALGYVSSELIALKEYLSENTNASIKLDKASSRKINITLPNPSINSIRKEGEGDDAKLYADMYVHL